MASEFYVNGNSKYRSNNLKSPNRLHFVLFLVEFPTKPWYTHAFATVFATIQHQLWRSIRQAKSERLLSAKNSRVVRKMFAKILGQVGSWQVKKFAKNQPRQDQPLRVPSGSWTPLICVSAPNFIQISQKFTELLRFPFNTIYVRCFGIIVMSWVTTHCTFRGLKHLWKFFTICYLVRGIYLLNTNI